MRGDYPINAGLARVCPLFLTVQYKWTNEKNEHSTTKIKTTVSGKSKDEPVLQFLTGLVFLSKKQVFFKSASEIKGTL